MYLIKILAKTMLIVLFLLLLDKAKILNQETEIFYSLQWKVSFVLFLIIAVLDAMRINYISFLFALFGVIFFNPFRSLEIPWVTYLAILRWAIFFINVWIILDLYYLMNRASKYRHSKILDYLKLNESTGNYEVFDGVYKYEISSDMVENLRIYMHFSKIKIIGDWYVRLDKEERQKVKKTLRFNRVKSN